MALTVEEVKQIGMATADEVMERIREREEDSLMLHSIPSAFGSPGIVVNEALARATPCRCIEYKPAKYIAVDNAFNRANYPEEIGKVYDSPPSYVAVEKVESKKLCFSKGIIGALSDEQEKIYCPTTVPLESPGLEKRLEGWMESVETCKAEIAEIPKGERLEPWLSCMSRELATKESNPARVHFDRADIDSAIEAAKRLKSDRDLYVFATYLGYTIDNRPPPGMQAYVIVHSDSTTETIKPGC